MGYAMELHELENQTVRPSPEGRFPRLLGGNKMTFIGKIALGNGTQWRFSFFAHDQYIAVGIENRPLHVWRYMAHPEKVANIYNLPGGDACHVADLINQTMGSDMPRHGKYNPKYCSAAV